MSKPEHPYKVAIEAILQIAEVGKVLEFRPQSTNKKHEKETTWWRVNYKGYYFKLDIHTETSMLTICHIGNFPHEDIRRNQIILTGNISISELAFTFQKLICQLANK